MLTAPEVRRGARYGALATLVMTLIMLTGMGTGVAPMPEPIPKALAKLFMGIIVGPIAESTAMQIGMLAHFTYGALMGVVYVLFFGDECDWQTGVLWGIILWLVMQIVVLPILGWGFFGIKITGFPPKIAVGTLLLHCLYGGILGWGATVEQ